MASLDRIGTLARRASWQTRHLPIEPLERSQEAWLRLLEVSAAGGEPTLARARGAVWDYARRMDGPFQRLRSRYRRALQELEARGLDADLGSVADALGIEAEALLRLEAILEDREIDLGESEQPSPDPLLAMAVRDAFCGMPPAEVEILWLHFWRDYTLRQIASHMNRGYWWVQERFYRGLRRLRAKLGHLMLE